MTKSASFDPANLPDLTGFVAIVTGGHSGIGLATTTALAAKNATVYTASRSRSRAEEAMNGVKTKYPAAKVGVLEMDLSDLKSVKKGAEEFLEKETRLHILVNNAGIMCTPYALTPQAIELQLATNYLSHFYFTSLLLPTLLSTATISPPRTVRIVNVSSDGHSKLAPKTGINFADMNLDTASVWTRYGHSKLCNVLHAKELAKRYGDQGIISVSLHPGTVKTGLSEGPRGSTPLYRFIQPLVEFGAPGPEGGAKNSLWCAASPQLGEGDNGAYFLPVGKRTAASKSGEDAVMAERLWVWSEGKLRELGF